MSGLLRSCVVAAGLLAIWISAAGAQSNGDGLIRIVNCDQKVQSHKRGICANHLSVEDIRALAPGVSWWYNWYYQPNEALPDQAAFEFIPMAWGDRPDDLAGLERYLAAGHKPRAVLAINEPNLRGQAFISPERTAALYIKIKAIADKYGIEVVGPNMSLGSTVADSITAFDPIDKKDVTYTFMVPFLKAFFHDVANTDVPYVAFHTYGNVGELQWAVGMLHKEFNRPLWVTEFAQWNNPNDQAARNYLIQATDFLERSPDVAAYSWFKERVDKNKTISLLSDASGRLTPIGQTYVAMPVHDSDIYYRIPGQLDAARYLAMENAQVLPTTAGEGMLDMTAAKPGAWLDYHLQVDAEGTYRLVLQVGGKPGQIEILQNDQVVATVRPNDQSWQKTEASVRFSAGAQTMRIRLNSQGQAIHSIAFAKD